MTKPNYGQPALIGGVVIGVLSALPIVAYGNACCCLWVVSGGLTAAYFLQENQGTPITPGDGALVGLQAGLIGAGIQLVLSIPIDLLLGGMERQMALRMIQNMPPEMREMFEQATRTMESSPSLFLIIAFRLVGFVIFAVIGAIFSTLGGLLGAAIFKKSLPPGTIDVPTSSN